MSDQDKINVSGKIPRCLSTWQNSFSDSVSFIGKTLGGNQENYEKIIFGIHNNDRVGHLLVTGKNNTGKSKLFELLIKQDYIKKNPFIVITNNNSMATNFVNYLKKNKNINETLINYYDPTNLELDNFNWFSDYDEKGAKILCDNLNYVLKKQLKNSWNDLFELLLRKIILTITTQNDNLEIGFQLINFPNFRQDYLKKINNNELIYFWTQEYPYWEKNYQANIIIPLKNRLDKLINDPLLKKTFSTKSMINLSEKLINDEPFFINLAKNEIGQEDADVLCTIIMSYLANQSFTYNKSFKTNNKRGKLCQIYFDDFPTFYFTLINNFILFTENNKFSSNVSISTLYSAQDDSNTITNSFKNLITFKLNIEDAQKIKSEFLPDFETKDISNLPDRHFLAKISINNKQSTPILGKTLDILN